MVTIEYIHTLSIACSARLFGDLSMSPRVVRLGSLADFAHGPASSFELSMVARGGLAEIREQRAATQNSDENEQILKTDAFAQSSLNSVQSPSAAIRNAAVAAVPTLGTPRVLAAAPSATNHAVAKQDFCYLQRP